MARVELEFTGEARGALAAARQTEQGIDRVGKSAKVTNRELKESERQLGRTTRGVLAGSGAFRALGRSVAFASASFLGAAGFTLVARDAIDAAVKLDDAIDAAGATFRGHAKEMEAWSKTTVQSMGLSERAALGFADQVGRALKAVDVAPAKTAAWSKSIVQLAVDLGEMQSKDPAGFIEAFDQAVLGRTRGLKQWAISVSDSEIAAEALSKGLVRSSVDSGKLEAAQTRLAIAEAKLAAAERDHGARSVAAAQARLQVTAAQEALTKAVGGSVPKLTEAQRAEALYEIVLRKTADAHGFFAKQAGDADVKAAKFRAALENLEAQIGTALLPTLGDAADALDAWLSKSENQEKVTRAVKDAVHALREVVATAVPILEDAWHVADHVAGAFGGWENALKILVGIKIGSWLGTLIGGKGLGLIGARTESGLLLANLNRLKTFGPIAIAVTLFIERKEVDKAITGFLRGHGLGGLTGGQITSWADWQKAPDWLKQQLVAGGLDPGTLPGAPKNVRDAGIVTTATGGPSPSAVQRATSRYANIPYQWGGGHGAGPGPSVASGHGRTGLGLDCSGYARAVLADLGITVSGTAEDLLGQAKSHPSVVSLAPGDLVFYEGIHPQHVMVYIGGGRVIGETHTGAQGPEVKSVTYLPITGTGRYWPKSTTSHAPSGTPAPTSAGAPAPTPRTSVPTLTDTGGRTDITKIPPALRTQIARAGDRPGALLPAYRSLLQLYLDRERRKGLTPDERADLAEAIASVKDKIRDANKQLSDAIREGNRKIVESVRAHPQEWASALSARAAELVPVATAAYNKWVRSQRQALNAALATVRTDQGDASGIITKLMGLDPDTMLQVENQWGRVVSIAVRDLVAKVRVLNRMLTTAITTHDPAALQRAIRAWNTFIAQWGEVIQKGVETVTEKAQQTIDQRVALMQASLDRARTVFETAFGRLSSRILAAFDRETSDHLQGMQRAEADAEEQVRAGYERRADALQARADARIRQLQARLTKQLAALEVRRQALTPAEQALRDVQAEHDAAAAQRELADAQRELADARASGDPQRVQAALDQLNEIEYQAQVTALQQQAAAERTALDESVQRKEDSLRDKEQAQEESIQRDLTAQRKALDDELNMRLRTMADEEAAREREYQDERDAQRVSLEDELTQWQTALENHSKTWADFVSWLQGKGSSGAFGANLPDPVAAMSAAGKAQGSAFADAFIAELQRAADAQASLAGGTAPNLVGTYAGTGPLDSHGDSGGRRGGFARGGKLPGVYVGREDTMWYRGTPGEHWSGRQLTKAMEDFFFNGGGNGGPTVVVRELHTYGATERQVKKGLADAVQPFIRSRGYRTVL